MDSRAIIILEVRSLQYHTCNGSIANSMYNTKGVLPYRINPSLPDQTVFNCVGARKNMFFPPLHN